jgi:hypothetical protein
LFHRITDISQQQKNIISEHNEKNAVINSDVRVLNAKQMTLAIRLRSITDSFRVQAHRFGQLQNRINTEQQNIVVY